MLKIFVGTVNGLFFGIINLNWHKTVNIFAYDLIFVCICSSNCKIRCCNCRWIISLTAASINLKAFNLVGETAEASFTLSFLPILHQNLWLRWQCVLLYLSPYLQEEV